MKGFWRVQQLIPGVAIMLGAAVAKAEPLSPEQEQRTFKLPAGFEIELVASESEGVGKFVTVDWDIQGRMWSMTALEYPVDANENPAAAQALYASIAKDKVLVWDTPYGRGPHQPRVFAEGLAIPLGVLPYKSGVYVQHGSDIVFLSDTNGDGKADNREVTLTGFGVQDSHLFPHQFTRAPGNWIWMAQGAFNYGKVRTTKGAEQQFDQTRMARFRYDGSEFEITSQGPCNIWGLVINGEGEAFIQEANDYGYPVMPFHMHANYPGCSDAQWKNYAPEFPGTAPHFKMGGTGLSGLALSDAKGAWPEPYADVMYVANPIIRKIQAIKMHRDGPRWRLEKLPDFIESTDEMFRPVAIKIGPDGCLYIVDWYNKIISHNEVPRNHPERDKKRGRIWRVKHKEQTPFSVPDFTKLSGDALIAKLGGDSLTQSHLAWQAITDRQLTNLAPKLKAIAGDRSLAAAKRISALWALEGVGAPDISLIKAMIADADRNVRREGVRALGHPGLFWTQDRTDLVQALVADPDPEVRAEVAKTSDQIMRSAMDMADSAVAPRKIKAMEVLAKLAREPLAGPTGKSTHSGRTIKIGEAYHREFERYLARMFLERYPGPLSVFLDSPEARALPLENRMVASLALPPEQGAPRVAELLPELKRPATEEELLRLAQFPDEPRVTAALQPLLSQTNTLEALLKVRSRFDTAKISPFLENAVRDRLWSTESDLALRLISGFKMTSLNEDVHRFLESDSLTPAVSVTAIRVLRELNTGSLGILHRLLHHPVAEVRNEAALTAAALKDPDGPSQVLSLWNTLNASLRRSVLDILSSSRLGGKAILRAVREQRFDKEDLDGPTLERLSVVLANDNEFAELLESMSVSLRPALRLNGKEDAWLDSNITLEGPFTVETWIKLDPEISNADGILGSPGSLDINFHDAKLRVWVGGGIHDAIVATKKIAAEAWTHVAVTRDETGKFRLYQSGELDSDKSAAAPQKFEKCRVAWTAPPKGTAGWLAEYRVWDRARTSEEIRADFDRSFEGETRPAGLMHYFAGSKWGKESASAKVEKTTDSPPLLTASEARALGEKFVKFRALAEQPGDRTHGKALFTTACMTCHNVNGEGGQIGPVLSGAGAMGVDTLLRAVLTPNAAMEAGYRIFRVEKKDGDILDGLLVSQDDEAVVLRRPNSEDLRIRRSEVKRANFTRTSMMPDGLLEALKPEEVSNLFAYLRTLK